MRLFALIGGLLLAGGAFFVISGVLRINQCLESGTLSWTFWTSHFWLKAPSQPGWTLGENAHWFIRVTGGLFAAGVGIKLLRSSTR